MKLQQEVIKYNFKNHEGIKSLISGDYDEVISDLSDTIYFMMDDIIQKHEKLIKLVDLISVEDRGISGDVFNGNIYHTVMFGFDLINAYTGDEGLEDGSTSINFTTHIEDWKLVKVEAMVFTPDGDEEDYSIYPIFDLPLTWKGKFKREV